MTRTLPAAPADDAQTTNCEQGEVEEELRFYTPPNTLDRSLSALSLINADASNMPEQSGAIRDVGMEETGKIAYLRAETLLRSASVQSDEMELSIAQQQHQLDDLRMARGPASTMSSSGMEEDQRQETRCRIGVAPFTESSASVDGDVSVLLKRQEEMQMQLREQQRQIDELKKFYEDRPGQNDHQGAQVEDFAPDIPLTASHMYTISGHLATSWKKLSLTELGLHQTTVERIEADYKEVQEKAYQALLCWRRMETSNATVGSMMTALQNVNRCDVKQVLKDALKSDFTLPPTPPAAAVPPESRLNAAPIEEPEKNCTERTQPTIVRPSKAFDAEQVQKLGGILDQLHGTVQKLTLNEVRGRIVNEIQSLLTVQEFYEEQMRSMIVDSMFLRMEDHDIAASLKENQKVRTGQSKQIKKLFDKVSLQDEICKTCKPCKDCKKGRRHNTFATTGPRPKIQAKPREAWSLYINRDGAPD